MIRRFSTVLCILSLVLCVATIVLWVRSFYVSESWLYLAVEPVRESAGEVAITTVVVQSWEGRCSIEEWRSTIQRTQYDEFINEHWIAPPGFYKQNVYPPLDRISLNTIYDVAPSALGVEVRWPAVRQGQLLILTSGIASPYGWIVLVFALFPAYRVAKRLRKGRHRGAGLCPACGYDLRASPDRCPECGAFPGA